MKHIFINLKSKIDYLTFGAFAPLLSSYRMLCSCVCGRERVLMNFNIRDIYCILSTDGLLHNKYEHHVWPLMAFLITVNL